jgi:CheY-like chemotaxis protein
MKKVLVIDDQESICRMLQSLIKSVGHEVRLAGNGREGLAICAEWNPDLILTDIFMPDQDGLEIIRALRKTAPQTRVIAMSGGGDMGDLDVLRTARVMGAVAVLTKPFLLDDLRKCLEQVLGDSPGE